MKLAQKEYAYPVCMIAVVVMASAYLSYGNASGPWYKVVYPNDKDAFAEVSLHADAIAKHDSLGVTVFIEDHSTAKALEASGAILLDPKGVSLCLSQ